MSLKNEIYKKNNNSFNFSLLFLVLVIILTIWLYWYNYYLGWVNNNLENEYIQKQKLVAEKKQQEKLKVYSLYITNKNTIDRLKKYSQIRSFINHLTYISNKYWVIFKWFSYSNWKLSTTVYTVSDSNKIDYQKTVEFLREYKKDKTALFNIEPIKWISTFESNQKFNITFKLK